MAKRQARKNSQRTERSLEKCQQFQKIAEHANQQAKIPDITDKILHIPDPKWLTRASRKLTRSEQTLLSFMLYENIADTTLNAEDTNICIIQQFINSAEDVVKCDLRCAMTQMLFELLPEYLKLTVDPKINSTQNPNVIKWNNQLQDKIPQEYYNGNIVMTELGYSLPTFVNPITEQIHNMIDWDKVLSGKDYTTYADGIMKIVQTMADPTIVAQFTEKRTEIVQDIITEIISRIPDATKKGNKVLVQKGYLKRPKLENDNPLLITKPRPSMDVIKYAEIIMNDNLYEDPSVTITEDMLNADPWLIAYVGLCLFNPARLLDAYHYKACQKFTIGEIAFTALSLLADFKDTKTYSIIHDFLLIITMRLVQTPDTLDKIVNLDNDTNEKWVIDTTIPKSVPTELIESAKTDKENVNLKLRGFNVRDIIIANYNMLIEKNISISHQVLPLLTTLGYTDTESAALCGYIEGIKMQKSYARFSTIFAYYDQLMDEDMSIDNDKDYDEEPDEETPENQTIIELTAKLNTLEREKTNQLEETHRKHNKEKKTLQYQLSQAEKKATALKDENEQLKKKLKYVEAERRKLQDTVTEYSLKDKDKTDETPQEDTSKNQYPSDIGKDLKIICFGGTANWVAEQRNRFPYIEFAGFEDTINVATIANSDLVLVNTFMFNHALYRPIKNETDRVGKDIHIFPGKGINSCSDYIIDTYQEYMLEHLSEEE